MKLTLEWLGDYLDGTKLPDAKTYCDKMTDSGSKVEGFEVTGKNITNVVVGKITKIEDHPDSDHLSVCKVDVGEKSDVQIVTNAKNIFVGALVAVALAPAKLAGDLEIKKGKIRGVDSDGMFCSVAEFGLSVHDVPYASEDAIVIIEEDCKAGDDIHDVYHLTDTVVEFEITSNRPDCFSVIGLARESGVTFDLPVNIPTPVIKNEDKSDDVNNYISVEVRDGVLCPRYSARVIKNVKIGPSPMWLRTRLRMIGIRPINNIVDITNYVMAEYGQPMHAFDKNFLEGGKIIVRRAEKGEKIITLDGVERTLTEKMLVICDGKKPVAVAGVMGGENSEITNDTTTVIFESANFLGTSVRTTARDLFMRTEASGRYEKGLDPENTIAAVNRACELVEELGCGTVVPGIVDVYSTKYPERRIPFEPDRINGLLGTKISESEMKSIFERLHFVVKDGVIIPPTWRPDIEKMADTAEEVARIHGYNSIESSIFEVTAKVGRRNARQLFDEKVKTTCMSLGLTQIETYSFLSPKIYDGLQLPENSPLRDVIVISNPLGEDTSVMRTTAIGSMLQVLSRNRGVRNENVGLFELAKCYFKKPDDKLADERVMLDIGFFGLGDFYTLKGMAECVIDTFESKQKRAIKKYEFVRSSHPAFHPGRSADIIKDGVVLGTLGQIHPDVQKNYSLDVPCFVLEIDLEKLFEMRHTEVEYKPVAKFPATTRDLAFVLDKSVDVGTAERVIAKYAGKNLEEVKLFDVYTSDALGADKKSIAFNLTLRDDNKTLTVEDAEKICNKVIHGIEVELGGKLR